MIARPFWIAAWLCVMSWSAVAQDIAEPIRDDAHSAQEEAQEALSWLQRMMVAAHQLNYHGVLVYGDQHRWNSLSLDHAWIDGVEYERLVQLTGQAREVVRHGGETYLFYPEHTSASHPTALRNPLLGFSHVERFMQHYKARLGHRERIANRIVQSVWIEPIDEYRYPIILWLDQETGLMLRLDLVNQAHQLLERIQFASIHIGTNRTVADFELVESVKPLLAHTHQVVIPVSTEQSPLQWLALPEGFQLVSTLVGQEGIIRRWLFSDGLATFSIFVEQAGGDTIEMSKRLGLTSVLVKVLPASASHYRVTLVGEVPLETLQYVASNLVYVETDAQSSQESSE